MLLSNIFSNRLIDLVSGFNKEDIISQCQIRNITSLGLFVTGRNSGTGFTKIDESTSRRNKNTGHFEIKEGIRGTNIVTFDISVFY